MVPGLSLHYGRHHVGIGQEPFFGVDNAHGNYSSLGNSIPHTPGVAICRRHDSVGNDHVDAESGPGFLDSPSAHKLATKLYRRLEGNYD